MFQLHDGMIAGGDVHDVCALTGAKLGKVGLGVIGGDFLIGEDPILPYSDVAFPHF